MARLQEGLRHLAMLCREGREEEIRAFLGELLNEANLISPLTLMTPLATIALGVAIFADPFGVRMAAGSVLALTGVLIIALRRNQVMPLLLAIRNRAQ